MTPLQTYVPVTDKTLTNSNLQHNPRSKSERGLYYILLSINELAATLYVEVLLNLALAGIGSVVE